MPFISRKKLLGLGWAIIAITVWSGSLVLLRLGVTTNLNAYDLTALRFGVAALILTPVALHRGTGTDRLGLLGLVTMIVAFGAPYILLLSLAMKSVPASAAGALNPGMMAVASVLLSRFVLGDRIGVVRFSGLLLTSTGVVLFAFAGGAIVAGHLILLVTGMMWASYILIVRRAAVPALNATAIVAVGSAIVYLPVYFVALPKQIVEAPFADVLIQAGFQGVLVSVFAIYAFNRSAELLGTIAGASLPALIPVITLCLGDIVLGETTSVGEIVSGVLATLGLVLILVGKPAVRWIQEHTSRGLVKKQHR